MPGFKSLEEALMRTLTRKRKSKGHVCFWGDREIVEIKGELWCSDIKNVEFDPDGYRLGLTCLTGQTREEWLRDCQRLIDSAADGEYYEMHVHPEDGDLFRRPNPDPNFLRFYLFCKEHYEVHPEVRDGNVRVWSLVTRINPMKRDLASLPVDFRQSFMKEYGELTFPLDRLDDAIAILEVEYACGR